MIEKCQQVFPLFAKQRHSLPLHSDGTKERVTDGWQTTRKDNALPPSLHLLAQNTRYNVFLESGLTPHSYHRNTISNFKWVLKGVVCPVCLLPFVLSSL